MTGGSSGSSVIVSLYGDAGGDLSMAAEVREPARVGSFLRELGCDGAAVETAERLLAAGGRAFESGWPSPRGVLVLSLAAGYAFE